MTHSIRNPDRTTAAYGALVLRLALGVALLAHGVYLKVFVFTMAGTVQFFEGIGLPGSLAWAVMLAETLGGAALLLGVGVRFASAALVPVLLGATAVHWEAGWLFENAGGGWEYPAFWTAALLAQSLLGPGAWALRIARPQRGSRTAAPLAGTA
jgi:putative oxidoreductase